MTALPNPFHPGAIFLSLRKGLQFLVTVQVVLPPSSSVVVQLAPQPSMVWCVGIGTVGTPRDYLTGNPVMTTLISGTSEHVMERTYTTYGLESYFLFPWSTLVEVSHEEPLTFTLANASTTTYVSWDFTLGIMEIPFDKKKEYTSLWQGLYNLLYFLGQFEPKELEELKQKIQPPKEEGRGG